VFAQSVGEAIATSLLLFFVPYGALSGAVNVSGGDVAGLTSFGFLIASILIVTVTLRVSCIYTVKVSVYRRTFRGELSVF